MTQHRKSNRCNTEYSTHPKTRRKCYRTYRNTRHTCKKTWCFSKNITRKQMKRWISIISNIKHKIIILLLNVMLGKNRPIRKKEYFINLSILSSKLNFIWINCRRKTLIRSSSINPHLVITDPQIAYHSYSIKKIRRKNKKVESKYWENNPPNQLFGKLDSRLIRLGKCSIFRKSLALDHKIKSKDVSRLQWLKIEIPTTQSILSHLSLFL